MHYYTQNCYENYLLHVKNGEVYEGSQQKNIYFHYSLAAKRMKKERRGKRNGETWKRFEE